MAETRLGEIQQLILDLGAGDLSARGRVTGSGDAYDAVVSGLNMLAEDLERGEHERARSAELARVAGELATSEQRMRVLLQQLPAVVWTVDRDLRVLSLAGGRRAALTGWTLPPRTLRALLGHRPHSATVVAAHEAAFEGEADQLEFETDEGTWTLRIEPLLADGDGTTRGEVVGAIAVATDVTEVRAASTRLQHAQKLESLGLLAGGIAHDFNNLLVGILGNASLILLDPTDYSTLTRTVKQIETSARRASELTHQLLAYSGRGRFVVERLDLGEVVREMVSLLEVSLNKRATLRCVYGPDLPSVEADAAQIRQIVMNLITNAAEAVGDDGGIVTIRTGVQEVDRAYLAETYLDDALEDGRYTFLEVSDTGVGMSPETRRRIFDPFFTTKSHGRGLGLAAVIGIVRGHDGAIKVYSERGSGTTFKVLLPAVEGEATPRADVPAVDPDARSSATVLVVDDEPLVIGASMTVLESRGYRVMTARDGVDAVALYAQKHGEIDVVLLDMTMPRMGGEDAFREMRRINPDIRVVLTSGYNEQEATSHFAGKGLAGFLQKPWAASDLLAALAAALASPKSRRDR